MKFLKLAPCAAVLLAVATPVAYSADACPAPGVQVFEDAAGDEGVAPYDALPVAAPVDDPVGVVPVPEDNADLLGLNLSEVGDTLVFTMKLASLAEPLASGGYIVRFSTDELPANGDEDYFVAMLNTPNGTSFVYGSTGSAGGGTLPVGGPRLFNITGTLEASSSFTPDGTLNLVLKRDAIPGLQAGLDIYNILFSVRLMAPTEDAAGATGNGSNATLLDQNDGEPGFYTLGSCGKSAAIKSSGPALMAGGFGFALLAPLALAGFGRRRR